MADAPATAPTAAIGYTQAPTQQWWLYENETTPELQWPQSVFVYDQMRRTDSQCKAVLKAVMLPVLRTPWRIDPAGARPEVVQLVADDLGLPIVGQPLLIPARQRDRFSWTEHVRLALLSLVFGHAFFEQVYRVDDDGLLAHLAKLEYRPPTTIERIDVARDGGLVAIKQCWSDVDRTPEPIPVSRLVAYVNEREGGNWLGTSLLRAAYKNWLLKDRLLRVQAQTIERNGMGIPVYEGAENESSLATGLGMATSLRSGQAAGAATPYGAKLRLMGVEGTLPDAKPAIDYHDDAIARAVLAHFLNLGGQQGTGSWALGSTFADFFTLSLQTVAQQIADVATDHIVEDLVDVNWGPDEPAPRLVFDEIGSRQQATAEALSALVSAGLLTPDATLEGATRQFYGLPPADPAGETPAPEDEEAGSAPADVSPVDDQGETPTGTYSVAAKHGRRRVRARFNPDQPRDPNGQWGDGIADALSDVADALDDDYDPSAFEPKLLGATRGSSHHVALFHDPEGVFTKDGEPGDVVAVNHDRGGRAPWGRDDALDEAASFEVASVPAVADGIDELVAKAKDFKPTDEQVKQSEESGPILIAQGDFGGHKAAVYLDVHGDLLGEGQTILAVEPIRSRHARPEAEDWRPYILDASPEVLVVDARRGSGIATAMREMAAESKPVAASADVDLSGEAAWIAAAAGVDTHPGGERLKRYWLFGAGAAKWATWTQLFDHLKKYIKNRKLLKATVSKWYRLRYGHNPPRHHVAASSESASAEAVQAFGDELAEDFGELADDEADDWEMGIDALSAALDELSGAVVAAFNPRQPRNPKGAPGGGRFRSMVDHLKDAIEAHGKGGKGHPFDGFDREQLRRVARKRGIELSRGESRDSIAKKLLGDIAPKRSNSRADQLAERQRKAGEKAAGVGVRDESPAKKARRERIEQQTNDALDELDRKGPPVTGDAALAAPPLKLEQLSESGDPRSAALWFRTGDNSLDTQSGMPGFVELNEHMRDRGPFDRADLDSMVSAIDSAMAESKLPKPIVVYRGMDTYSLGDIGDLEGVEFTDKAFASATTDEAHAKNFGTVLRITVPAGVGAIRMADRDPSLTESEILLDRDLKYRVVAERIERNERGRISKHELDVEVVA